MTFPPSLLRVRVRQPGRRTRRIWLPLILLWPLAIAIFVVLLPILLIVAAAGGNLRKFLVLTWRSFGLLCALRGLHVEVDEPDESVFVSIT